MGELAVVVAPVLRFMDVGFNAQVIPSRVVVLCPLFVAFNDTP
jgi:hypothetical protein